MNTPQILMIVLYTMVLTINLMEHGNPRPVYNFWWAIAAISVEATILYYGGFWG